MLPDPLEWVLDMLGFNWPHADEDKLLECAQVWRNFAAEVQGHQARGATYASNVLAENAGDAIEGFGKAWEKFSGNSGYFNDAAQAAEVIAFTFEAAATLVIGMKVAVIVQLAILAAEIIAAQAAAPFTLGLSEIGGAAATLATREMVRRILKEVAKQLLDAIMEAAKEPVISALEAMASDLIAQTVNQNFGAQKGYDLGRTAKEGQKAATDALKNTGESLGESLRDGAGGRAGRRARNGLDSAAGHGSDGSDSTDGGSDGGSSGSDSGSGSSGRGSGSGSGSGSGADGGGSGSGSDGGGSGSSSGTGSDSDSGSGSGSDSGSDGGGSGAGSGRGSGDSGGSGNRGGADSGGSTSHSPRASDNVGAGTGADGGSGSRTDSGAGSGTNPDSGSDAGANTNAGAGTNPSSSADSSSHGSDPSRSVPESQPLPPPDQRSPFDEGYSGGNDSPYGTSPTPDSGHTPDSGPTPDSGHTPESGPAPDTSRPDADAPSTQPTPDNTPDSARPDPDNTTTQPARDTTPDAIRPDADNITTQPAPDHTPEGARPAPAPDNTPDSARPDAPQPAPTPAPSPDPVAGNPPSSSDNSPDAGSNSTSNGDNSTGGGRASMPHAGTPPQGAPVQHTPSSGQPVQQRDPAPGDPMPTVDDPDDTTVTTQSAGTATLPPPTQHTADTGTPATPSPQGAQPHTPQANGPMTMGAMPPQGGGTGTPHGTTPSTGNTNGNASARPNRRPDGSQAIHDASQQRRPEQPAYNPRLDGPRREETSRPYNPRLDGPRRDTPTTPPGNNRRPDGSQIIHDHTQQPTPERPPHNPRLDGPTRDNEPRPGQNDPTRRDADTPHQDDRQHRQAPSNPSSDSNRPDGGRPDGGRPDGRDADAVRPEGAGPENTRPDGTRPESTRPDGGRPDGTGPESTRPDSTRPDHPGPDGTRPDSPRPDDARPDNDNSPRPDAPATTQQASATDPATQQQPRPADPGYQQHPNQQPQQPAPHHQQPYAQQAQQAPQPHPQNQQPPQQHAQQPAPHHQPQQTPQPPSNGLPPDAPHSLDRIRNDLQGGPQGLLPARAIDQQLLADAVPRNPDGSPVRHPDPFQPWSQLQNDGGLVIPGRSNNCVDCSRSFLETWFGNPQVSAPRTWDTNPDGSLDRRTGERSGIANINRWANTPLRHSGGTADGYARIAQDLKNAGHGAGSIIVVEWKDGSSHAFNAVNHNGRVVWVDAQSGAVSEQPLHTQGVRVWHLTLDANRQPYVAPTQQSTQPQQQQHQQHTQQQQPYQQVPHQQQPNPYQQQQPTPYQQHPQQQAYAQQQAQAQHAQQQQAQQHAQAQAYAQQQAQAQAQAQAQQQAYAQQQAQAHAQQQAQAQAQAQQHQAQAQQSHPYAQHQPNPYQQQQAQPQQHQPNPYAQQHPQQPTPQQPPYAQQPGPQNQQPHHQQSPYAQQPNPYQQPHQQQPGPHAQPYQQHPYAQQQPNPYQQPHQQQPPAPHQQQNPYTQQPTPYAQPQQPHPYAQQPYPQAPHNPPHPAAPETAGNSSPASDSQHPDDRSGTPAADTTPPSDSTGHSSRPEENAADDGSPATPKSDPDPTPTDQADHADPHHQNTPSNTTDTSDTTDTSAPADHSTHSEQPDHSEKPDHSEQPDRSENSDQNSPTAASDTRNRERPGGLDGPTDEHQQQVEDSIPKGENGEPQRHPDPEDGNWVDSINDPGPDAPGRSNNCVDAALAAADTYSGNPTAAAHRTPDTHPDGTPSDRGENNGRDRIENTLGARFSDYGNGRGAFNRLENDLRNSGHGSQAVIVTQDSKGRAHAWNVVNHNGKITYVDAQTGQRSNKPLHDGTNGVHAIPLNANRRPLQDGSPRHNGDTRGDRRPAAEPAGNGKGKNDPSPDDMDIDEVGQPHDDSDVDMADADGDENSPTPQYAHPHDRGESDTSWQETGENSTFKEEGKNSKEYGLEPDKLQQDLRAQQPVHRVRLDNVHNHLNTWADNGSLARALRAVAGDARPPEVDAGRGPLKLNRDDLIRHLPGFDKMEHGEQMAVISSLARLSLSFHEQHGVGNNPNKIPKPYLGRDKEPPEPGTRDSAAKNADGSLGVKGHKASAEKFLADIPEADDAQTNDIWKHGPDFTDRNYAVLEVEGPNGEISYVVDSSVPTGEKHVSGRHSEKHLIEWLKRSNEELPEGKSYTPKGLYTEREPCGKGQGHAKCSDQLRKHLKGIPIYYSTTYRTDPEGVKIRKNLDVLKRGEIKEITKLSDDEVREEVTRRVTERYGPNSGWTSKHLNELSEADAAGAREKLKKVIESDYKKMKDDTRTEKEKAIVREMERHIASLEDTWQRVYPQLVS